MHMTRAGPGPAPQQKHSLAHLFILLDTSRSSMKHSMLSGRSEALALINFLSFSHSWYRRSRARELSRTLILYLVLNSSQKWLTKASSKSLPPR